MHIIASSTEICKLSKGSYVGEVPTGEKLVHYRDIAAYFGRFKHLTMMIGGSGQNWNVPGFDLAVNEVITQLAAYSIKLVVNGFRPFQDMSTSMLSDGSPDHWHFRRRNHNIKTIVKTIPRSTTIWGRRPLSAPMQMYQASLITACQNV